MNQNKIKQHLGWLHANLVAQRHNLSGLLLRLKAITASAGLNFSLHYKFLRLLEQIAFDRKKELKVIDEIEAMEQYHHDLKARRLLRRADTHLDISLQPKNQTRGEEENRQKPRRHSLLKMIALLAFFSPQPKK